MKPNAGSDEILFFARAALKNDASGDYERDPVSSTDVDQQGWYVYAHSIPVLAADLGSMNLEILSPAANFTATKNISEPVEVKVTDNSGNPVTDSGVIFFNASFSNGGPDLQLFDDGTHGDTSAHDGIFTNEWLPVIINGGETATSCTIRASAEHASLGSAEATVSGTISPPANPASDDPVSDSPESDPVPDDPESNESEPDLIIEDISWEPADPYEKDNMTFEVTVANRGSGASGTFGVKCYIDENEVSSDSISGLEAGSNASFTFDWIPPSSGDLNIKAVADADSQVPESDEGNNEKVEPFTVKALNTSSPSTPSSSSSSSSSSSRGGSGGGGGGGSPEPASNIEVKELSQEFITNGNQAKFEFLRNVTCIASVEFEPKRSFGKVTTIVEMLKGQSSIVQTLPSGTVYRHVNIWVGNQGTADPKNIENAVVSFRVEKEWINSNGVDESEIRLCRHSEEKWGELSTRKVGEDGNYVYFEAETPGFSPFAITVPEASVSGVDGEGDEKSQVLSSVSKPDSEQTNMIAEGAESSGIESSSAEETGTSLVSGSKSKIFIWVVLLLVVTLVGYLVSRKRV